MDEVPELAGSARVMYEENGTDSVGAYSARDPEGAAIRWSLSGDDAGDFSINAAGVLRFSASPDFEGPTDADTDAEYEVAIQASDGSLTDAIAVTINVVNVDEPGSVTLSPTQPVVGVELPASLSDPDGSVSEVTWMWERSTDQNTWTDVSGAAAASYMPVAGDVGSYLRATATYADGGGPNKSARAVSENPVESLPQPEFITVPDAALVEPTEETVITSPKGEAALTFPANARDATFQVRMYTSLENCTVDEPPDGDVQLCVRVDLFDASGNREEDTILNEAATLVFELSAEAVAELGGEAALSQANDGGRVQLLTRDASGDPWMMVAFELSFEEDGRALLTVSVREFSEFALVITPAPEPVATPTPEPTQDPTPTPTPEPASESMATPTPEPASASTPEPGSTPSSSDATAPPPPGAMVTPSPTPETTTPATTTAPTPTPETTAIPPQTAPTATAMPSTLTSEPSAEDGGANIGLIVLIVVLVAAAVAGGGAFVVVRRRRLP